MSVVYPTFKRRLLELFLLAGPSDPPALWVLGVDDSYVYSATHTLLTDIPVESIVVQPAELSGGDLTGTTLSADDLELSDLETGRTCHGLIVLFRWASETESALVAFIDQTVNMSLPQNLITGQLLIEWSDSGICRI